MKRKQVIIAASIAGAILILVAGYFLFANKKEEALPLSQQDMVIPTIMPEEIGLTLSLIKTGKFANNGVEVKVTKLTDISAIDYELSYTSKGDIPRGAIGHVDIKSTDKIFTQQLPFGTCSDKCHFDEEVSGISLTLKISKKNGSIYQVVSPFSL